MSCFPESVYACYVDGELDPAQAPGVERHLVQCRGCRALVVALEGEAHLLADALHERSRPSFRLAQASAPPRELALGVVPTLALGVLALAVLGWLFERELPSGIDWLNPFSQRGAYEMIFDLLFLLRDRAPGLLELMVATAGMASVALLLLFALSAWTRRFNGPLALGLAGALLVASPEPSAALELRLHEQEIDVAAGETLERTLIANADTVRVDGVVDGDLVVVAERLILRGEVRGNVFGVARTIEVSGRVTGNLHAIGESVRLDGSVGGNLFSLSERVTIADAGRVERDSSHVAERVEVEGRVGRDLFTLADRLDVRGAVARHVDARVDRLALLEGARVGGDVDALLWRSDEVDLAPGAAVAGELRVRRHEHRYPSPFSRYGQGHYWVLLGIRLGAAFGFGMLIYALAPGLFAVRLETTAAFFRALGVGFAVAVAAPIALLLVAVTLLGIPIALLGLAAYLAALYLSGILIAALLGVQLTRPRAESGGGFGLALLVGLVLVGIAAALPFVGPAVRGVVMLAGLGLLAERLWAAWRAGRALR